MPGLSDPVHLGLFDFRSQWKHGAENLADGSEIVLRDPLAQLHEVGVHHRLGVEHLKDILDLHFRLAVMESSHDAGQTVIAKRNQHPPANHRLLAADPVGKHHVQRDGQSDIAKLRHE